jgi:isoleucyl-tRNA synthetase
MDYRSTVNLPKTDFPMKAGLVQREPGMLEAWEKSDLYAKIRARSKGFPKWVLHDGPPYANGELHAGGAFNKILKDIVVKSKQMAGFDSPFVPGWDCHGLPIEHKVVTDLGSKAKTMTQVEIRRACRAFALKFVDLHRAGFKRLGIFGSWDEPYLTLDKKYIAKEIEVFAELYERGSIYKGLKPIYWCASCSTALAEAEVEYNDRTSPSIYVKFEASSPIPGLEGKVSFVIWTTTPWTLPANLAISVHPDFEYSAIKVGDETLIMATELASRVLMEAGVTEQREIKKFKGRDLVGLRYKPVIFPEIFPGRIYQILLGEHVTLDAGTGCVHTAPGHGQDDYVVCARYGIEPFSPVDAHGIFTNEAGPYSGMFVFKANAKIVEDLRASGALLHSHDYQHSYPHCWRCMNPVIYRATPQWFISMKNEGLRTRAIVAIQKVQWVPPWGEERITLMVRQRPDWCISRQRAWGVPIPVFYCKACSEPYATKESFNRVRDLALSADDGIDRWFDTNVSELIPSGAKCAKCGATEFEKETDILDVWFDSGVSNRSVCEQRPELGWPVDAYLEGTDQHRGWFQSSLLSSVAAGREAPFRVVLTTGYVVDGQGKKMSKKIGNFYSLNDLVQNLGADVSRLWVASENYRQDIRISDEILKRLQDAYRSIRNTMRYLLSNLGDFTGDDAVAYAELEEVDRWALNQLQVLKQRVLESYAAYDFHQVYHAIYDFCNVKMSAFYLDILKDRLYTFAPDAVERRAGQTVMAEIISDLLRLFAPILPYTCDEAWAHMPGHLKTVESVHLAQFPAVISEYIHEGGIIENWDELFRVRAVASKALEEARRDKAIGTSLEALITITPSTDATWQVLNKYADQLPWVFIVSKCELNDVDPSAKTAAEGILVTVERAPGKKCVRCWNYRETVGTIADHPEICDRCVEQLGGVRG